MKITLAQINTTPGDFVGNANKIKEGIHEAAKEKSRVVVFPELTICGYNVKDMVYDHNFIDTNLKYVNEIREYSKISPHLYIFIGYIDRNRTGQGKPFRNMAAVIKNGLIIATHQKRLLPMGDVFDEARWFEPGDSPTIITIDGHKVSLNICEECWYADKGPENIINHKVDPMKQAKELGCDTIISLNSSPYHKNKFNLRKNIVKEIMSDGSIKNFVYCNQYGGQDELVFDGNSFMVRNGVFNHIGNPIVPRELDKVQTLHLDTDDRSYSSESFIDVNKEHLSMTLLGLHDYANKIGVNKFVVGSSGGIDSAVVIALSSIVFGSQNVYGIKMPSKWSSDHSVNDAVALHKAFGINDLEVKIDHDPLLEHVNGSLGLGDYNPVADENIQARMRGQVVMHFSNATGALALVTANKTESAMGYSTLFGDLAGTFAPLGDLYKLEVYQIASMINEFYGKEMIPQNIINKAPSAELAPGQTDEASLLPYPILDPIVKCYIESYIGTFEEFREEVMNGDNSQTVREWVTDENNEEKYAKMIRRIDAMEFKRRLSPLCPKLTQKSFGTGRRMPIVRK